MDYVGFLITFSASMIFTGVVVTIAYKRIYNYFDCVNYNIEWRLRDVENVNIEQRDKIVNLVHTLGLLIKNVPDLFKEEIELVRDMDYPKYNSYFVKDITRSGRVYVYFYSAVGMCTKVRLDKVLSRAEEIKKIKEKCCPKKGKK